MLPGGKLRSSGQSNNSSRNVITKVDNNNKMLSDKQNEKTRQSDRNAIFAARYKDFVMMRVNGMGTMDNSIIMVDFVSDMMGKGYGNFILDMNTCTGMDSTFMGALLDISFKVQAMGDSAGGNNPAVNKGELCLLNVSSNNLRLLKMLGVDQFVKFATGVNIPPIEMTPLPAGAFDKMDRMDLIKRAHQNLVRIDKSNEERFGAFLDILCKELEHLKKTGGE